VGKIDRRGLTRYFSPSLRFRTEQSCWQRRSHPRPTAAERTALNPDAALAAFSRLGLMVTTLYGRKSTFPPTTRGHPSVSTCCNERC
jgi:hypothetical protein